jgi:hypothetical protein
MKKLSYLRLASYAICIAAFCVAASEKRLLRVFLWGSEDQEALEDRQSAKRLSAAILKQKGFQHTRMSGSEVVAAAITAAKKEGNDMRGYGEPQITLNEKDGSLVWTVSFYHTPRFPGGFFGVGVDDQTGATTIYPGM